MEQVSESWPGDSIIIFIQHPIEVALWPRGSMIIFIQHPITVAELSEGEARLGYHYFIFHFRLYYNRGGKFNADHLKRKH